MLHYLEQSTFTQRNTSTALTDASWFLQGLSSPLESSDSPAPHLQRQRSSSCLTLGWLVWLTPVFPRRLRHTVRPQSPFHPSDLWELTEYGVLSCSGGPHHVHTSLGSTRSTPERALCRQHPDRTSDLTTSMPSTLSADKQLTVRTSRARRSAALSYLRPDPEGQTRHNPP